MPRREGDSGTAAALADAKAQALSVQTPDALRLTLPPGFESVVSNLLSNAIKYTPE